MKWTKDDGEPDKEHVIIENVGKCSTVNIKNALRTDHGKYEITGTNSSGTKSAFIKVDVMGKLVLSESSYISNFALSNGLNYSVFFCVKRCSWTSG